MLEAELATSFVLTGAESPCKLNGESIPSWQTLDIEAGDRLETGFASSGTRINCQYWGRDIPGNTLLSDGLSYTVGL